MEPPSLAPISQLWSQLFLKDGLVCQQYQSGPVHELTTVPIIPSSYHQSLLQWYHSHPSASHLGPEKTAARIPQVGHWVGMLHDSDQYCRECSVCQRSKPPSPEKASLLSMPIGRPWQMVAVDHCHLTRIVISLLSRIILVSGWMLFHFQTRKLIA